MCCYQRLYFVLAMHLPAAWLTYNKSLVWYVTSRWLKHLKLL